MEKTQATDTFWDDVKTSGADSGDDYWVRRIGGDPDSVDIILDLILKGEKCGTFGVKMLQERQPEITPTLGGVAVLVDFDGMPRAAIKTTQLTPVAYKDITEAHIAVEGPGARKLEVWQGIHWPYWTRLLEPHGLTPSEDMTVMVEHFDLVYPKSD
jgi:uncharacterized protein YhfF